MPSFVWKYFTVVESYARDSARCNLCGKVLKTGGGTTNMKTHLTRMHPDDIEEEEISPPKRHKNMLTTDGEIVVTIIPPPEEDEEDETKVFHSNVSLPNRDDFSDEPGSLTDLQAPEPEVPDTLDLSALQQSTSTMDKSTKEKTRQPSIVWKFFTMVENETKDTAQCNLCNKELKTGGGTTNMKSHLKRKHADTYSLLSEQPPLQEEFDDWNDEPSTSWRTSSSLPKKQLQLMSQSKEKCFVCNGPLRFSKPIVGTTTRYSNTPLSQCISEVLNNSYFVVVSNDDKVCQGCHSTLEKRDLLKDDLRTIENSICALLKAKFNLHDDETLAAAAPLPCKVAPPPSPAPTPPPPTPPPVPKTTGSGRPLRAVAMKAHKIKLAKKAKKLLLQKTKKQTLKMKKRGRPKKIKKEKIEEPIDSVPDESEHISEGELETTEAPLNESSPAKVNRSLMQFFFCNKCRFSTSQPELLAEHTCPTITEAESNSGKSKCLLCGDWFTGLEELRSHFEEKHSKYYCCLCYKVFLNESLCVEHKLSCSSSLEETVTSHPAVQYTKHGFPYLMFHNIEDKTQSIECGLCVQSVSTLADLYEHVKTHSGPFNCTLCDSRVPTYQAYSRHFMYHTGVEEPVDCVDCETTVVGIAALRQHMKEKHGCCVVCEDCGEQFQTDEYLRIHQTCYHIPTNNRRARRHTSAIRTSYECKLCGIYFETSKYLKLHNNVYHTEMKCKHCGKIFKDFRKFKNHERYHKVKTNCMCWHCGKVFTAKGSLESHMRQHTGLFKYKCEVCGKGCQTELAYIEHVNLHSDSPKMFYTCDKCGKQFMHHGSFYKHKKWHEDPQPFPCKICGLRFRHPTSLSYHRRKEHTHERPFKCDQCESAFYVKQELRIHLISHTGKYPHNCETCNKGFVRREHLSSHLHRIHGVPLPPRKRLQDLKVVVPDENGVVSNAPIAQVRNPEVEININTINTEAPPQIIIREAQASDNQIATEFLQFFEFAEN